MTQCNIRYAIFSTEWGYCSLAAGPAGVLRSCLPRADRDRAETAVTAGLAGAAPDDRLYRSLQRLIRAYFAGRPVDFDPAIPLDMTALSAFARLVLSACRRVGYGRTASYGRLAAACGRPSAARAVAGVLSANPFAILVPCHRIIRCDGRLAGFSGPGGRIMKKRLLNLEGLRIFAEPMPFVPIIET